MSLVINIKLQLFKKKCKIFDMWMRILLMKNATEVKKEVKVCGEKTEIYSRVCGFYRPVNNYNKGKTQEFKDRQNYGV